MVFLRSKWMTVPVMLAFAGLCSWSSLGCKASASVNVNDAPTPENDPTETENATDDPGDAEGRGRSVEGHSADGVPTATLPGFRMFEDGTSRVFLEVSAEVSVAESKINEDQKTLQLAYRFAGVKVPERVNRLPIPTTHFKTPVALVQVVQVGDAAELRITLRQDAEPKTRLKRMAGGTVLSVDFPKWRDGQVGKVRDGHVDASDSTQATQK